jgi:hypothetical protein
LRLAEFIDNWHMKVVRIVSLKYRPALPPEDILSINFCYRTRPHGHRVPEGLCQRKISMTPLEIVLRYDEHKETHSSNFRENPAVDNSRAARTRGKQGRVHDELSVSTETCSLR